jgi:hypothetical protein
MSQQLSQETAFSQAKEIMKLVCGRDQRGMTGVQVTHSEADPPYSSHTIQRRDDRMASDTSNCEVHPYAAVKQ